MKGRWVVSALHVPRQPKAPSDVRPGCPRELTGCLSDRPPRPQEQDEAPQRLVRKEEWNRPGQAAAYIVARLRTTSSSPWQASST